LREVGCYANGGETTMQLIDGCLTNPLFPDELATVITMPKKNNETEETQRIDIANSELCDFISYMGQKRIWSDFDTFRAQAASLLDGPVQLTDEDTDLVDMFGKSLADGEYDNIADGDSTTVACINSAMNDFNIQIVRKIGMAVSITQAMKIMFTLFVRCLQILAKTMTYPENNDIVYENVEAANKSYDRGNAKRDGDKNSFVGAKFDYDNLSVSKNVKEEIQDKAIEFLETHTDIHSSMPTIKKWIREMTASTTSLRYEQAMPEIRRTGNDYYALMGRLLLEIDNTINTKFSTEEQTGPFRHYETLFLIRNYCLEYAMMSTSFQGDCLVYYVGEIMSKIVGELASAFHRTGMILKYYECCMLVWMMRSIGLKVQAIVTQLGSEFIQEQQWIDAVGDSKRQSGDTHPTALLLKLRKALEKTQDNPEIKQFNAVIDSEIEYAKTLLALRKIAEGE